MSRVITWVKFLPAILFMALWVQFINDQLEVEKAIFLAPLGSPQSIQGLELAMANPWQRKSAAILYFKRLMVSDAHPEVLIQSEGYANALWKQAQFPGLLEVLIRISILKGDQHDADQLTKLYLSAYPYAPFAETIRNYLRSG